MSAGKAMHRILPALFALLALTGCEEKVDPLDIGAKNVTENMLLAEMTAQLAESVGIPVERHIPLGTTFELFESLKAARLCFEVRTLFVQRDLGRRAALLSATIKCPARV